MGKIIQWTYELVKNYIEVESNSGCKLISTEYKDNKTFLLLECKCTKQFQTCLQNFIKLNKRQCNECGNLIKSQKLRYSLEEINEIITSLGYELLNKNYARIKEPLTMKDNHGYILVARIHDILKNKYPRIVGKSNPYTIYNLKLWCELNNKSFELISRKYISNGEKLWWKCLKDNCLEEFDLSWNAVLHGQSCPYCSGRRISVSNCLATKNPELAKEWHPTKNGNLTPYDVTCNTEKEVWWQCSKNPKHEWKTKIHVRNKGCNCPYCIGKKPSEDYNLLVNNPELCEEWDYVKNKKRPEDYTHGSVKKVWWICKECKYEWKADINSRSSGSGCPECNKSKGEKECKRVFISKDFVEINQEDHEKLLDIDKNKYIYFIPQMKFDDLVGLGNGLLSYDFYIPRYNLFIEYDGEFHYKPIKNYKNEPMKYAEERLKKQKIHDNLKDNYAQNNNIKLLRIPYWDFDNIEEILTLNILTYNPCKYFLKTI